MSGRFSEKSSSERLGPSISPSVSPGVSAVEYMREWLVQSQMLDKDQALARRRARAEEQGLGHFYSDPLIFIKCNSIVASIYNPAKRDYFIDLNIDDTQYFYEQLQAYIQARFDAFLEEYHNCIKDK